MGIFFDIIGSMVIRGTIVAVVVSMSISLNDVLYEKSTQAAVKQNLAVASDVIRTDARSLGYNVASNPMLSATSNGFKFLADIDDNGVIDTVNYYLGPLSELSGTENPNDRILYRRINSSSAVVCAIGVTSLNVSLFDATGFITGDLAKVKSLSIKLTMQSGTSFNARYRSSYWEMHFFPSNV